MLSIEPTRCLETAMCEMGFLVGSFKIDCITLPIRMSHVLRYPEESPEITVNPSWYTYLPSHQLLSGQVLVCGMTTDLSDMSMRTCTPVVPYMELIMASFLMTTGDPEVLLSFLVSIMLSTLRVVPLKNMLLSTVCKKNVNKR